MHEEEDGTVEIPFLKLARRHQHVQKCIESHNSYFSSLFNKQVYEPTPRQKGEMHLSGRGKYKSSRWPSLESDDKAPCRGRDGVIRTFFRYNEECEEGRDVLKHWRSTNALNIKMNSRGRGDCWAKGKRGPQESKDTHFSKKTLKPALSGLVYHGQEPTSVFCPKEGVWTIRRQEYSDNILMLSLQLVGCLLPSQRL